ncbi:hypothetical protein IFM89_001653 [Coptis chinensis]|uniref:Protein kinase domain-containing protein n=1 Tax=Coptis chinensis TaxID=261450 RepID=A0A835LP58_9MAGN|nr:hypothetical protein IFM89_001653 [Coptis chinensis]
MPLYVLKSAGEMICPRESILVKNGTCYTGLLKRRALLNKLQTTIMILVLFLLYTFFQLSHSADKNSSYYYNQCLQSTCGNSILQFPFNKNPLCSTAYTRIHCENNSVYLTDEENPSIKFKFLQSLTKEVYSNTSVRLVDSSLIGCGPIPPLSGSSPNAEKWLMLGSVHYTTDYRTGTLFNCTKEPDSGTLLNLRKVPCLECGETSNLCYFYDGNLDNVANCRTFRTAIPVKIFNNLTGVVRLRSVLQKGFVLEWDRKCNLCMNNDGGRCGYLNQERKNGDEFCFCRNGIHKNNCSDGVNIDLNALATDTPKRSPRKWLVPLIVSIGTTFLLLCLFYILNKSKQKLKQNCFNGEDEQTIISYFDGENSLKPASVEAFLHNYTLGRPTKFSYKQLKKYTNNFTDKIGQGGFGSVFKGQIPNSFTIAVKLLDEATSQSGTQFLNEVLTIGRIHHNHLLRLLGYCFEQEKEEEEMAMRMELVGLWCIQFKPSSRPSMRKVIDMLEGNVVIDIPSSPFNASISAYGWRSDIPIAPQFEHSSSPEMSQNVV